MYLLFKVYTDNFYCFFSTCFLFFFLNSFSSLWMNPNGVIYVYTCAYSLCIYLLWKCACLWARRKDAPGGVCDKSRCKCIQITFTHCVVVSQLQTNHELRIKMFCQPTEYWSELSFKVSSINRHAVNGDGFLKKNIFFFKLARHLFDAWWVCLYD